MGCSQAITQVQLEALIIVKSSRRARGIPAAAAAAATLGVAHMTIQPAPHDGPSYGASPSICRTRFMIGSFVGSYATSLDGISSTMGTAAVCAAMDALQE